MKLSRKFYIFDMDGTLTKPTTQISRDMEDWLWRLARRASIIVISGATSEQMEKQIQFREMWSENSYSIIKMSQSGNVCEDDAKIIWENKLPILGRIAAYAHIHKLLNTFQIPVLDQEDLVQDRGAQISYSILGHHAPREDKCAMDPDGHLRREMLKHIPFNYPNMCVKVGGTTCFDYNDKDGTKAGNLRRLLKPADFKHAVYVGDQLYDGGNDSDVKKIENLLTVPVTGPHETLTFIKKELGVI